MPSLLNSMDLPLSSLDKGVPPMSGPTPIKEVAAKHWNLLREDLPLPVAVLRDKAVRDNSAWMRSFLGDAGAVLSPHGKTTMCPALFDLQLADGAWAITVSTLHQIQVARSFGVKRIFLANQLIGRQAIDFVIGELAADSSFEFLFLADSQENVRAIADAARKARSNRPLQVLVELGYPGGRTGCRSRDEALDLARYIESTEGLLVLRGIEGFEGLLKGADNGATLKLVENFVGQMVSLARLCDAENLFAADPIILSAGGSAFYDVVVEGLGAAALSRPSMVLVRSGCYITHDSVLYAKAVDALRERNPELANARGGLTPALEVWAYVQSRPETEKLIAGLGKRDVSYDDQPVALTWFRPGSGMEKPQKLSPDHTVMRLNDQHCHMTIPAGSPLKVGDMVGFGISHPCLTFDKWRVLHVVDENYQVISSVRTYF